MANEVESRYIVPDQALFDKLGKTTLLGPYTLQAQDVLTITDHYLDTHGRAIIRQGWACRLRQQNGGWRITLKGPGTVRGAVMSRTEWEIALSDRIQDVARWPLGRVREQVQELTGGLPLQKLVTIRQTRRTYLVTMGTRRVGVLSVDLVRTRGKGQRNESYMLECELLPDGREADLGQLDALLVHDFGLLPEKRTKLQRALELIERAGSPDLASLAPTSPYLWRQSANDMRSTSPGPVTSLR